MTTDVEVAALAIRVRGVVQGVGFRPFVFRLAIAHAIRGWVQNDEDGVLIHAEASASSLDAFVAALAAEPPRAASVAAVELTPAESSRCARFEIRESGAGRRPTARITPDLAICDACAADLFNPRDRRYGYPYITCTDCGPRYSIIRALPYDRDRTTMRAWPLCGQCAAEFGDVADRRFHAQPIACPACGPHYALVAADATVAGDAEAARVAADRLRRGEILAVKGIGGYHLACDASDVEAVRRLRARKFRKEKPFALMARDLAAARDVADLSPEAERLLTSAARPIVLAPARIDLPEVAPDHGTLGVMLPYAPLHHLLFDAGAPAILVMTSGNRSSEPVVYRDDDARARLDGIADAFLVGERPIARRVEDSIVRAGALGPMILRRARGYAPGVVATLPRGRPVLALGADLKNTVTLVVDGEAFGSPHLGDLDDADARAAFRRAIDDLVSMYGVSWPDTIVAHDAHPEYASTAEALRLPAGARIAVQHHRAHVASVLAERGALDARVLGVSFDGTGYGDDGTIWGGEFFAGSVRGGFDRVAHLRVAPLPGGDAAARVPEQAAAGLLCGLTLPDLTAAPFGFSPRYERARALVRARVRTFPSSSAGRLFDTAAVLLGFTREITFEGQAAMWLEQIARRGAPSLACPFAFDAEARELDWRPALAAIIDARLAGAPPPDIARAFHRGLAQGVMEAVITLGAAYGTDVAVLSGGVFQNELLLEELIAAAGTRVRLWINQRVPPGDGGISLGQAAMALANETI